MKTSFDKHLDAVLNQGNVKTASANTGDDFINKLASEILGDAAPAASAAPTNANHIADAPLAAAVASNVSDGVIVPAIAASGANVQAVAAGDQPAQVVDPGNPAVKGTGIPGDNTMKAGTEMPIEADNEMTEAQVKEASIVGSIVADAMLDRLEKIAATRDYSESVSILKEAGLLDSYNILDAGMDEFTKTASEVGVSGLDKIASNEALTHEDIIDAAGDYVEFVKTASAVEGQARYDAQEFVKTASAVEDQARYDAQEFIKEASAAQEESYLEDNLVKQAASNDEVRNAVLTLNRYGLV